MSAGIEKGLDGPGTTSSVTSDKHYVVRLSIGSKLMDARRLSSGVSDA
jgi:hypothetical protein